MVISLADIEVLAGGREYGCRPLVSPLFATAAFSFRRLQPGIRLLARLIRPHSIRRLNYFGSPGGLQEFAEMNIAR